MLGYMVSIWREHARTDRLPLPVIVPVLLSHDARGWRGATEVAQLFALDVTHRPMLDRFIPSFELLLLDLTFLGTKGIRALPSPTALARVLLLLLSRARVSTDFAAELAALMDLLRVVLRAPSGRDDFATLIYYVLGVADVRTEDVIKLVRERLSPPASEVAMTAAEALRSEGRLEGEARGRAEGEARGRAESLLLVLNARFGDVTREHEAAIRGATCGRVERWLVRAVTAASIADVLDAE
jgi:hypothetical protein